MVKKLSQFSIGPIIGALLSFIVIPIITFFISPEEYGRANMFSLALSIVQMVLYLGQDQAYVKKYYEVDDRSRLLTNAMLPPLTMVLVLEICIALGKNSISQFLFDSDDYINCVHALMLVLPCYVVQQFALVNIRMAQKGTRYSVFTILLKLLNTLCTVLLLLLWEKSFESVVWGAALAEVSFALCLLLIERKTLRISLSKVDFGLIRQLLKFGLPLVPAAVVAWMLGGMDKVMLRMMCDYTTLGIYSTAEKVAAVLAIVQSCFTLFWLPVAHEWNKLGVEREKFTMVGRTVSMVMGVVFLLILLSKDLVFLIFASDYSPAKYVFPFLLLHPIMYSISEVTVMGIYFSEKTSYFMFFSVAVAVINLVMNALFIPMWGATGAAIATGMSYMAFFWLRTLFSRRLWYRFPLGGYLMLSIVLFLASLINSYSSGVPVYLFNISALFFLLFYFSTEFKTAVNLLLKRKI